MSVLLFQADTIAFDWTQFGVASGAIFLVVIFLFFLVKILPTMAGTWKEVRLAEVTCREKEAESRAAQAASVGQLSGALQSMSDVLNNVAVEQRQATEDVRLQQRVNADIQERSDEKIDKILDKVEQGVTFVETIEKRVDKLEGVVYLKRHRIDEIELPPTKG